MNNPQHAFDDRTPGVGEHEPTASYLSYTVGLALAISATIASFIVAQTNLLWPPGIPVGLIVLALAQIGVHLVFFCIWAPRPTAQTISWPSLLAC
jgi:cytochrome o ubiquinol oxidase operon protein cyoD